MGRTLLPLYKNLKDKQLREMVEKDGLVLPADVWANRDELIRIHKEFLFTVQAGYDALRMGMYPNNPPTKEGLARAWNLEIRLKDKRGKKSAAGVAGMRGKSETEKRREMADNNSAVEELAGAAQRRMQAQLREALLRRKQRKDEQHV